MANSRIGTRHLRLPNPGDAQTFVLIKVLTALQKSLRRMGNFTTKENAKADYWIKYFPFEKKFSSENNNPCTVWELIIILVDNKKDIVGIVYCKHIS